MCDACLLFLSPSFSAAVGSVMYCIQKVIKLQKKKKKKKNLNLCLNVPLVIEAISVIGVVSFFLH